MFHLQLHTTKLRDGLLVVLLVLAKTLTGSVAPPTAFLLPPDNVFFQTPEISKPMNAERHRFLGDVLFIEIRSKPKNA